MERERKPIRYILVTHKISTGNNIETNIRLNWIGWAGWVCVLHGRFVPMVTSRFCGGCAGFFAGFKLGSTLCFVD